MAERLLVGYDGFDRSREALDYTIEEWPAATYLLVYVIDPTTAAFGTRTPTVGEGWYDRRQREAEETLTEAVERLREQADGSADENLRTRASDGSSVTAGDATVETRVAVGNPAAELVEMAGDWDADHVVVGSHGRTGVSRVLMGSVAEQVVRSASIPVTVVR